MELNELLEYKDYARLDVSKRALLVDIVGDLRIEPEGKLLCSELIRLLDYKGTCSIGYDKLSEIVGLSRRKTISSINALLANPQSGLARSYRWSKQKTDFNTQEPNVYNFHAILDSEEFKTRLQQYRYQQTKQDKLIETLIEYQAEDKKSDYMSKYEDITNETAHYSKCLMTVEDAKDELISELLGNLGYKITSKGFVNQKAYSQHINEDTGEVFEYSQ